MEMRINRLPAITWNRMDINDIPVNLPKFTGAELTFDTNLNAEQATHATVSNSKRATHATAPLPVSTGAGTAADAVFEGLPVYNLTVNKGEIAETKAEYLGKGDQGAVLQVTAGDDSQRVRIRAQIVQRSVEPVAHRQRRCAAVDARAEHDDRVRVRVRVRARVAHDGDLKDREYNHPRAHEHTQHDAPHAVQPRE